MRLRVYQSGKGDCLLLTSADGHHMLVDGGMPDAYVDHVAAAMGDLAAAGEQLDLVYVSHIDQDHVGGVLRLFDDAVAWRVFDFQTANGNPAFPAPKRPRPPEVGKVWHNAFAEQIGRNAGAIGNLLAASAAALSGADEDELIDLAGRHADLSTSINEAIRLSRRLDAEQLGIPTNPEFGGRLAMVRDEVQSFPLGGVDLTLIGPFARDLRRLRTEWNQWLRDNKKALADIREDAERDAERLEASELDRALFPFLEEAKKLGERAYVTAPNLASIMLLADEAGTTVLLTGDGHRDDILAGLKAAGRLQAGGGLHVEVLKVQHHGSENNIDDDFCQTITADDYVFCGNGEHENPDLDVLRAILRSRLGTASERSANPEVGQPFRFWFNSSSSATTKAPAIAHMKAVESLVAKAVQSSAGAMTATFLDAQPSFDVLAGP
ncbi:MAG TPA: MBL fold metallo-hydrolase [Candidatus Limnocylindrales bacterium]|nr:MBL fold metallo-hydrolase [Candidatus Limnocylindrales bacterium]